MLKFVPAVLLANSIVADVYMGDGPTVHDENLDKVSTSTLSYEFVASETDTKVIKETNKTTLKLTSGEFGTGENDLYEVQSCLNMLLDNELKFLCFTSTLGQARGRFDFSLYKRSSLPWDST